MTNDAKHKGPKKVTVINFLKLARDINQITDLPPVRSAPIPFNKKGPSGKLVCVYGTTSVYTYLNAEARKAQQEGKKLYRVIISLDPGILPVETKIALEHVPQMKFFNLLRITFEVANELLLLTKGIKGKIADLFNTVDENPSLLNHIWDDPRFSHLDAIVWPAYLSSNTYDYRQMVAMKPEAAQNIEIKSYKGDQKIKIEP